MGFLKQRNRQDRYEAKQTAIYRETDEVTSFLEKFYKDNPVLQPIHSNIVNAIRQEFEEKSKEIHAEIEKKKAEAYKIFCDKADTEEDQRKFHLVLEYMKKEKDALIKMREVDNTLK